MYLSARDESNILTLSLTGQDLVKVKLDYSIVGMTLFGDRVKRSVV